MSRDWHSRHSKPSNFFFHLTLDNTALFIKVHCVQLINLLLFESYRILMASDSLDNTDLFNKLISRHDKRTSLKYYSVINNWLCSWHFQILFLYEFHKHAILQTSDKKTIEAMQNYVQLSRGIFWLTKIIETYLNIVYYKSVSHKYCIYEI